jgi:hypothetical protein
MTFLAPPDAPTVAYEFYAPFAHVEGKFEWCRLRTPTHGVFDAFILPGRSPVVVYVDTEAGERFMQERYPECETHRVSPGGCASRSATRAAPCRVCSPRARARCAPRA